MYMMLKQADDAKHVVPYWNVSDKLWNIYFGFRTWTLSLPNLFLEERRLIMDFAISHTPAEIWHYEP